MKMTHNHAAGAKARNQAGLTLVETLVAILVGLIALAGIGYLAAQSRTGSNAGNVAQAVGALQQNLKDAYSNTTVPTNNIATLAGNGLVPPELLDATGNALVSPLGAVTLAALGVSGGTRVTVNMPIAACQRYVKAVGTSAERVLVNGSTSTTATAATTAVTTAQGSVNQPVVATQCAAGTNTRANVTTEIN